MLQKVTARRPSYLGVVPGMTTGRRCAVRLTLASLLTLAAVPGLWRVSPLTAISVAAFLSLSWPLFASRHNGPAVHDRESDLLLALFALALSLWVSHNWATYSRAQFLVATCLLSGLLLLLIGLRATIRLSTIIPVFASPALGSLAFVILLATGTFGCLLTLWRARHAHTATTQLLAKGLPRLTVPLVLSSVITLLVGAPAWASVIG